MTLLIQTVSAASARVLLVSDHDASRSSTARGFTRPLSKSTVSDPDADRGAGLVAERAGCAQASPIVRVARCRGERVSLIVIGCEAGAVLDRGDFVFEKQAAGDRAELHDAGMRVSD